MTAWEARIVGEEWAREWGRWCAATRAPETPAQRYAAIPAPGVGAGHPAEDPPWSEGRDLTTRGTRRQGDGCRRPQGRKRDGLGTYPHSSGRPSRPASSFTLPTCSGPRRYTRCGHRPVATPRGRGHPTHRGALQSGGPVYDDALSRLGDKQGPLLLMFPTGIAAALRQELDGCEGLRVGGKRSRTAPCWPSSTGTPRTGANGTR